jgi:hypothetical protein
MNKAITIRHLDDDAYEWIGEQAAHRGLDEETLVIQLIQRGIDLEQKKNKLTPHHDLDALAGTWTEEEAAEFEDATEGFRRVDPDPWH